MIRTPDRIRQRQHRARLAVREFAERVRAREERLSDIEATIEREEVELMHRLLTEGAR